MLYRLLLIHGKTHGLYYEFSLHRIEHFGNYILVFIPNLRVLIYRERQVNYLNNVYYIFGKV